MAIFFKLLGLFQRNEPHRQLLEAYAEVHQFTSLLPQTLAKLRAIQKELIQRKRTGGIGFGGIGLQKTLFVEEEFIQRLEEVAQRAEQRYYEALAKERQQQPVSPLEEEELKKITQFLKQVQAKIPDLKKIEAQGKPEERLLTVESALREITELARGFYAVERHEKDLVRRVLQSELSHLLKRIYQKPNALAYHEEGKIRYLYTSTVSKKELRALKLEAEKINAAHDPDYEIIWRHWWRDIQTPERDATTPLKDPHINVTLKVAGKKKDIHLLLAA